MRRELSTALVVRGLCRSGPADLGVVMSLVVVMNHRVFRASETFCCLWTVGAAGEVFSLGSNS